MINCNGEILSKEIKLGTSNRAFLYGDGIFETLKVVDGRILFWEDHYFRLMSSMRIVRMEIPMNFTMECIESQVLSLVQKNKCEDSARVRITVYRNDGGNYLPQNNKISYVIKTDPIVDRLYQIGEKEYEVELYKDFYVPRQLLSSIKSTNRLINITGSIFANENGYANCFLFNENKNVIEALQGNIFILTGNRLATPPVSEGCINGVMRKQVLALAKNIQDLEVSEEIISPFDLQKADEMFVTNVIMGIQPITKYRKKEFDNKLALDLLHKLNKIVKVV